jgi:hypothetical protein
MSIVNQKRGIFAEISAKRTLVEGFSENNLVSSFESITNDTNPLTFLTDLLSSLVGMESLKDVIVTTLTNKLPDIENEIKFVLKKGLNGMVSCQINPSIPSHFLHDGPGINLEIKKIDFNNMLLTEPSSELGGLLYSDIENGIHSTDFNTFLYNVIQSGEVHTWMECLDFRFIEHGSPNNVVNIKVNKAFTDGGNNLKDLNNTLVDNISLLDTADIFTNIIDNIFGVISKKQGKSKNQTIQELKIDNIIESLINQEDDETIDDSFFEFDNDALTQLEIKADNKLKGVKVVDVSKKYDITTNMGTVSDVNKLIKSGEEKDLGEILKSSIDKIGEDLIKDIPRIDQYTVKLDFVSDMVKNIMGVIGNIIISPKIISIMAMNHYIIYGEVFDDPIEFIKKNKYFIKGVFNGIRDVIMELLLGIVLKRVEELVLETATDLLAEQVSNTSAIMSSLVGVPTEIARQISGITKNL